MNTAILIIFFGLLCLRSATVSPALHFFKGLVAIATLFTYFVSISTYIHSHIHTIQSSVFIRRRLSPFEFLKNLVPLCVLLKAWSLYKLLTMYSIVSP
jgi:hypothetical protein